MKRNSTEPVLSAVEGPVPSQIEGIGRRALLGVACASPVLVGGPVVSGLGGLFAGRGRDPWDNFRITFGPADPSAPPPRPEALQAVWQQALADYRRAEAAVAALERSPDEDAFGDAIVAMNRALERLLTAPAPDPTALATKLALARRHLAWELPAGDAAMAAIEQDALRMASPSPGIFQAEERQWPACGREGGALPAGR